MNETIKKIATKQEIKKLGRKPELKAEQDKIVKLQTYDLSHFTGQRYFANNLAQLYLVLQPLSYTLERLGFTKIVVSCKSKGLSIEKLTTSTTTNSSLSPSIQWYRDSNFCVIFKESCLKQRNATFTPRNRINLVVVYELDTWSQDLNSNFILKYCLFAVVKLAKNLDLDNYRYSGYGIGFNFCFFSFPNFYCGKNTIIFRVEMSSSVHID